jgi:hypothetical protein
MVLITHLIGDARHGSKRLDRSVSAITGCYYGLFLREEIVPDQGVLPRLAVQELFAHIMAEATDYL